MSAKRNPLGISTDKRFWLKVYARGDCWEWRGAKREGGYGHFRFMTGSYIAAHRYAYEVAKGPIGPTLYLDHLCRHRWCVRPSHLEAVSASVNQRRGDGVAASNAKKTHCIRGHEFTDANTLVEHVVRRKCRACCRDRDRARRVARRT